MIRWGRSKTTEIVIQFFKALHSGKRVLWLNPKYVVMDWDSWTNLKAEVKKKKVKMVVWDETVNIKDEDWAGLLKILDHGGSDGVAKA